MSLVRDALARAEREAAARAARERGSTAVPSEIPQPYRARGRRRWRFAIGVAAAAFVGAIAAVLLFRPPAVRKTAPGASPAVVPASAAQVPMAASAPGAREPSAVASAPEPTAIADASLAGAGSTDADDQPEIRVRSPVGPLAGDDDSTPPPTTQPAGFGRSGAPPAAPRGSYAREVALDGDAAIRLGGIAWSEAAPLAYLNGRLVGVGEYVEGFRVTAIDRDLVTFDGGDERPDIGFSIRLR